MLSRELRADSGQPSARDADYLTCLFTSFVISNMLTCALPPNTGFSESSDLIIRLFFLSCRPFFLMYAQSFFVSSVRGSGFEPTTSDNAASGVTGFMNAAFGLRLLAFFAMSAPLEGFIRFEGLSTPEPSLNLFVARLYYAGFPSEVPAYFRSAGEAPLRSRVSDSKTVALGVALRPAAGERDDHREVAPAGAREREPRRQQRRLRAAPARGRTRAGAGEQRDPARHPEGGGRDRAPALDCDEQRAVDARRQHACQIADERGHGGLIAPALGQRACPL